MGREERREDKDGCDRGTRTWRRGIQAWMRRCGERICCNGPCPALCLDPRSPSSCLTCARGMPSGAPLVIRRRQCRQCRQCRGAALLLPLLGPVLCFGFSVERRPALLPAREVSRVVPASAPPGSSGRSDEFGPRRAVGSKDVDGRGVQHELPSFGPFLFLEDALLPRGSMPPFGKHPHAGLLSLTLLLRGDCVQPWDNIHGECATLHPGGMYVVDSAAGVVHSEDRVIANPDDSGAATHAIFLWLDPGIFLERPSTLATSDVFLPAEIPAVTEQGGLTVRVLLGRYLGRTSAFGHLHRYLTAVLALVRLFAFCNKTRKGLCRCVQCLLLSVIRLASVLCEFGESLNRGVGAGPTSV